MPAASSAPGASLYNSSSKKKKPSPLAVVQAVAQAAQAATAAATAVAQTSPSYVAPSSSSSSSSSTSSPSAPTKAPPSLAKEFIKDSKKPKTVSGKYAKASEKAQAKKAKQSVKVKRKTAEVKAKYNSPRLKTPKFGPGNAYTVWEGSNKIASKAKELSAKRGPMKPTARRQKAPTTLSGPKPRKVATRLEKAVSTAKPTFDGLDSEQSKVLRTVLNQGVKAGADRKTLLSAVETGLVESGLRNLDYGDADSQGWRQERAMYYKNPTNVKASAKRYFQEAAEARAPGMTAGNIAQAAQQSAFPERYDQMAGQAKPLLKEFTSTRKQAVPKGLKQTAKQTLGKKPTQAILRGGKVVKDSGKPSKKKLVVREMFYDPGVSLKDGAETASIGGHSDHLHFASDDPASMLLVAKKAQALGMLQGGTGENPAFDTIDAQHAPDGYHYRTMEMPDGRRMVRLEKKTGASGDELGQALDIAGSPEQMSALNQWIASNAGGDVSVGAATVPIKGTKLGVELPVTTAGGTVASGGVSAPVTSPVSAGSSAAQVAAELKRKGIRSPSLAKRLAKIDRWMTSPLTAETPEISQELIDRILGK